MSLLDQPVKPTNNIKWAELSVSDGVYTTANKVEQSDNHKNYGWGYPESPPRAIMNWWQNSVWRVINYITLFIDSRVMAIADNFSYSYTADPLQLTINDGSTQGGRLSTGSSLLLASQTTLALVDGTVNYVYAYHSTPTVLTITVSSSLPPTTATYFWMPLYEVTTAGGVITSILNLRSNTLVRKATPADVTAGTNPFKLITPYALNIGYIISNATTTIFGKLRLADSTDVDNQSGDDVLTAESLSMVEMRSSNTKYGTVILSDSTTLIEGANRSANPDDVLTVGSFALSEAYASETAAGFVKAAVAADVITGTDDTKYIPPSLLSLGVSSAVPTGVIMKWVDIGSPPAGWLYCDSTTVPDTPANSALRAHLAVINTALGLSDIYATPDFRGEFARGWVNGRVGMPTEEASRLIGSASGEKLKAHSHAYTEYTISLGTGTSGDSHGANSTDYTRISGLTGGDETRPKNINLHYIIKL